MRTKLADVARLAGVDVSTASRVLRGEATQRIREETRERVLQSARTLNYAPNQLARGLRMARSATFGIVVPQLDNPVFASAIFGAEKATLRHGYSLLIAHRSSDATDFVYQRMSHGNRVDGLLVASLDDDKLLLGLRPEHIPEAKPHPEPGIEPFEAMLDVTEPMGMETLVYCLINGAEVCARVHRPACTAALASRRQSCPARPATGAPGKYTWATRCMNSINATA